MTSPRPLTFTSPAAPLRSRSDLAAHGSVLVAVLVLLEAVVDSLCDPHGPRKQQHRPAASGLRTHPLPDTSVGGLAGLVEIVDAHNGQADLPNLANELSFEVDDLLPLIDAGRMLKLLEVEGAQVFLTETGRSCRRLASCPGKRSSQRSPPSMPRWYAASSPRKQQ